jgi:hypothetical protein
VTIFVNHPHYAWPLPSIAQGVDSGTRADVFNGKQKTATWTADTSRLTGAEKWENQDGDLTPSLYWDITLEKKAVSRQTQP